MKIDAEVCQLSAWKPGEGDGPSAEAASPIQVSDRDGEGQAIELLLPRMPFTITRGSDVFIRMRYADLKRMLGIR